MALSDSNMGALKKLQAAKATRIKADAGGLLPEMTPERIKLACLENEGFETPELNDKLYLHFQGFRRIENLEPYVNVRALWLEGNAISRIEGLSHLVELRSLFLMQNTISRIEGLEGLSNLVTLNLAGNNIEMVEGLSCLPQLNSLNLSKNALASAAAIEHLAECPALTTLDLSDNSLPAATAPERPALTAGEAAGSVAAPGAASGECLSVLAAVPRLATLYLKGNPLVRDTRHYRKAALTAMPRLQYLDDRPIFPVERAAVAAWAAGGQEAERAARAAFAEAEVEKERQSAERFKAWAEEVRAKRAAELTEHNARLAGEGLPPVAELPRKSYVTYGRVTHAQAAEQRRMRDLIERAEKLAKNRGYHGTAAMDLTDLAREYWREEGALPAEAEGGGEAAVAGEKEDEAEEGEGGTEAAAGAGAGSRKLAQPVVGGGASESKGGDEAEADRRRAGSGGGGGSAAGRTGQPTQPAAAAAAGDSDSDCDEDDEDDGAGGGGAAAARGGKASSATLPAAACAGAGAGAASCAAPAEGGRNQLEETRDAIAKSLRRYNERRAREEARGAATAAAAAAAAPEQASAPAGGAAPGGAAPGEQVSALCWGGELDAALGKLAAQAAFDWEKVARALRNAVGRGVVKLPRAGAGAGTGYSEAQLAALASAEVLTPEACRLRFAALKAAASGAAGASGAAAPAGRLATATAAVQPPVASTAAPSSCAEARAGSGSALYGSKSPASQPASGPAPAPASAAATAAPSSSASSSHPLPARFPVNVDVPEELAAIADSVQGPVHGHSGVPGRPVKPVSELLQGDFGLSHYREYVAPPSNLPSFQEAGEQGPGTGTGQGQTAAARGSSTADRGCASGAPADHGEGEEDGDLLRSSRAAIRRGAMPAVSAPRAASAGIAATAGAGPRASPAASSTARESAHAVSALPAAPPAAPPAGGSAAAPARTSASRSGGGAAAPSAPGVDEEGAAGPLRPLSREEILESLRHMPGVCVPPEALGDGKRTAYDAGDLEAPVTALYTARSTASAAAAAGPPPAAGVGAPASASFAAAVSSPAAAGNPSTDVDELD